MQNDIPTMIPVASSNIKAIGYNSAVQFLYVEFLNGGLYRYDGVGESIYDELMSAESHGSFFAHNIKNKYPTTKLK